MNGSAKRLIARTVPAVTIRVVRPAGTLHLVRHGEVENPDHLVYANLDGFGLSARGRRQAKAVGEHLGAAGITTILTSPLQRAQETARLIAKATGAPVVEDDRLTEWRLSSRWAGRRWESIADDFPGELEAYLAHPRELPFAPETLADLAARMEASLARTDTIGDEPAAVVSHQDPIQALRRSLTGTGFVDFHIRKPGHGGVVTLVPGPWTESGIWEPDQGPPFPPIRTTEDGTGR